MKESLYLKGLNGLRAIASISVVIGHIELIKKDHGINNVFLEIENWGSLGVNLFFVLSGFLITTLLIREKKEQHKIHLKNFYVRRILRIWPLYFIILFSSVILFNYYPDWKTWVLCLSIFPNIAHALSIGWTYSPHIWSIGVEEQFYLFWPTILKWNQRIVLLICLGLILFYPILPHFLQFIFNKMGASDQSLITIEKLFDVSQFNVMATGAFFSILYYSKNKILEAILSYSEILNKALFILPFAFWFGGINFSSFQTQIYSVLFGYMIVLLINGTFQKVLEIKILKFLGKISYGIYMYHWLISILFIQWCAPFLNNNYWFGNILYYFCVIGCTILTAFVSFELIEKRILKLKNRYN